MSEGMDVAVQTELGRRAYYWWRAGPTPSLYLASPYAVEWIEDYPLIGESVYCKAHKLSEQLSGSR